MLKRVFDLLSAALACVLLAPMFAVIAICIKLDSRGPVFFRQERVGRHGRPFQIFKFRTMNAQPLGLGLQLTVSGDPRITRVGAVLRHSKLDELPQVIDVLRGTMSWVGPRPEVPKYVAMYPPAWRERLLSVRPGVTDFASVYYRNEGELLAAADDPEWKYVKVILPAKLRYSLHYVDNPSLATDMKVFGLSFQLLFAPAFSSVRNAMSITDARFWMGVETRMSALNRRNRLYAAVADALLILACWQLTYLFRLGFERWQPERPWYDNEVLAGVILVYLLSMALSGVPRGLWRFFGFDDFRRVLLACIGAGLFNACWVLLAHLSAVPRAVLVLHPIFCVVFVSLARLVYRLTWEHAREIVGGIEYEPKRAIVLGAGDSARQLVSAIHRREGWTILALLDDDPAMQGLRVCGVRVQGQLADLAMPHVHAGATHALLALDGATPEIRQQAAELARHTGLVVMSLDGTLPLRAEGAASDRRKAVDAIPL